MSTRQRPRSPQKETSYQDEFFDADLHVEEITDEDIESYLDEQEYEQKDKGFWNLPTVAGLSIIGVGIGYLLQTLGLSAFSFLDLAAIVGLLPWLAGVLIILLGFGVLSWSPGKRKKKRKKSRRRRRERNSDVQRERRTFKVEDPVMSSSKKDRSVKKLTKSRQKKVSGVCGGIGEYFGVDPTLVRIGLVIATVFGAGVVAIPLYILLAFIMASPDSAVKEERITIIRE